MAKYTRSSKEKAKPIEPKIKEIVKSKSEESQPELREKKKKRSVKK